MGDIIRVLEDPAAIQVMFRRLIASGAKAGVSGKNHQGRFELLACDPEQVTLRLDASERERLAIIQGENATLNLEDRTMHFEGVVAFKGPAEVEGIACGLFSIPRTLHRTDAHRFIAFVPDQVMPCSFSNARGALLQGTIQGLGPEGLELAMASGRQDVREVLRVGEEATLDIPMEGNQRFTAVTKVAYFGEACVGLRFTDKSDKALLGQYQKWLDSQQQLQAKQDRDAFGGTGPVARPARLPELPGTRVMVDRDPLILVLAERDDFPKRLAEGLGRKFGFAWLNYIKGHLKPQLKELGAGDTWGRTRLILVHHQLAVASPLELTRQLVEQEHCPLPILIAGTEEQAELKANRAVAAGAIGYLVTDPFKILQVLKRLDETIQLFQ